MEKTVEEQMRDLLVKHPTPPLEVIIPILEKAGRGEQQLVAQIYSATAKLAAGTTQILKLRDRNMKTVAKVCEVMFGAEGLKLEPVELTESTFSVRLSECPMLKVGKGVSMSVKSRFCDLICTGGSRALMDTVLGSQKATCEWDKALLKGAGRCTVVFKLVKAT